MTGPRVPDFARERRAVAVVFAVHGAAVGSFASRIPWLQDRLHLDPGQIGLALVTGAVGALIAMPFTGRAIHRRGSATMARRLIPLWCAAMALPSFAPNLWVLCGLLFVYGATAGTSDVAMNAQAVAIEGQLGRPIMSGLHGAWSVGGLLGAGGGALAAHTRTGARTHLGLAAVLLIGCGVWATHLLVDTPQKEHLESPPLFALPARAIWWIGAVGFCAIFAEASAADWCAVYLRTVTGATDQTAAAAYATFALTMAAGRIAGDAVVARVGVVRTVRGSGVTATLGAALVTVARNPALAFAGFALLGVGVATVVPLAFAAAGRVGEHAGQSIAGVATIAYGAGLAAPAIVGGVAQLTSLPVAFALVTALATLIFLGGNAIRPAAAEAMPSVASEILPA
ncbi:MAG: MFS transporter [Actinomycetota bacterium]